MPRVSYLCFFVLFFIYFFHEREGKHSWAVASILIHLSRLSVKLNTRGRCALSGIPLKGVDTSHQWPR